MLFPKAKQLAGLEHGTDAKRHKTETEGAGRYVNTRYTVQNEVIKSKKTAEERIYMT